MTGPSPLLSPQDLEVVVLMGGLGTRLKGQIADLPKAMADIHGHPFFFYPLELLKSYGFREFIFCTGYGSESVKRTFQDGSGFGVKIRYSDDGDTMRGTAGALRRALPLLRDDFVLVYGDSYMDLDYAELVYEYNLKRARRNNLVGLMSIIQNKNRWDKSNVVFRGDKLLKYSKKNPSVDMEYIDYGVSILRKSFLNETIGDCRDLADVYETWAAKGLLAGFETRKRFYEIGTPGALAEFKAYIQERLLTPKPTLFLDRDGTLNAGVPNPKTGQQDSPLSPADLHLLPGTIEALRIFKSLGYRLIVITNQPAAAKGKTSLDELYRINHGLINILEENGISLDEIFMCPHHPTGLPEAGERFLIRECDCRKPKTGLLESAARRYAVLKGSSYMVGDSEKDILAGKAFGVKTVYLKNGQMNACVSQTEPDLVFDNLSEFAKLLDKEHRA